MAAPLSPIPDISARGIAAALARRIRSGEIAASSRLPTIRSLAADFGVSPTTVSAAWTILERRGLIDPRGRQGTFVRAPERRSASGRYRAVAPNRGTVRLDLATGVPDPDLLPDPRRALERVSRRNLTTSYLDEPVLAPLEDLLRSRWPFEAELFTVVDGAMDAVNRLLSQIAGLGDCVAVENPGFPPVLDLLDILGIQALGVDVDMHGMVPSSLADALRSRPVAVLLQPRAHNPSGTSMDAARASELSALLDQDGCEALVIEDDHSGDIAWADEVSIGRHLPDRCVHIRSFSKSHGPDLRLAAVGGAGSPIADLIERRLLGPAWSSRVLQAVLLEMLRDPHATDTVRRARHTYRERRDAMVDALAGHGVNARCDDGINLWLAVSDEAAAVHDLATRGIGVAPGSPFEVGAGAPPHVRVTIGLVSEQPDAVAEALAAAARCGPSSAHPTPESLLRGAPHRKRGR